MGEGVLLLVRVIPGGATPVVPSNIQRAAADVDETCLLLDEEAASPINRFTATREKISRMSSEIPLFEQFRYRQTPPGSLLLGTKKNSPPGGTTARLPTDLSPFPFLFSPWSCGGSSEALIAAAAVSFVFLFLVACFSCAFCSSFS